MSIFNNPKGQNNDLNAQREESVKKFTESTVKAYKDMYGEIEKAQKKSVDKMIDPVSGYAMKTNNRFISQIKKDYDGLFNHLETRTSKLVDEFDKINGGSTKASNVNAVVPSGVGSSLDVVNQIYQLLNASFGSTFSKELFKRLDDGVAVGSGDGSGARKRKQDYSSKKNEEEKSAGYQVVTAWMEVDSKFNDLIDLTNRSFVQSKELNNMVGAGLKTFDNLRDVVKAFRDQEGVADSIVSLIMGLLETMFGYMVDAMSDNYNTQQEIFTNYMLYAQKYGDRNIGYLKTQEDYLSLLATEGLEDNIRNTTLMKKYVELASKGLDKQSAYESAMRSAIYDVIAPNLDQTSSIFLDFQTRGMASITNNLAGMVESVRSTAGSSRIAMNSLSTIIDKLGPVELYAQKGLLGDDAAKLLSFLESQNLSTQDATSIVNDLVTAISNPYQTINSGTPIQQLLAQQVATSNGNIGLSELYNWYAKYANDMLNPTDNPLYREAKLSAYGIGIGGYYSGELATMPDAYELVETTTQAYDKLAEKLAGGDLQTAKEMANITVTNSEIGMGVATLITELEDWLLPIMQDVADIADFLVGADRKRKDIEEQASEVKRSEYGSEEAFDVARDLRSWAFADIVTQPYQFARNWITSGSLGYAWDQMSENAQRTATDLTRANVITDYNYDMTAENIAAGTYIPPIARGAKGAYLTEATPLIAGEAGPEFVIPEQKLVDTIGTGLEQYLLKTNLDPDYTAITNAIYTATSELIKAIVENGGNVTVNLDNNTGLMNMNTSTSSTSLRPIMGK